MKSPRFTSLTLQVLNCIKPVRGGSPSIIEESGVVLLQVSYMKLFSNMKFLVICVIVSDRKSTGTKADSQRGEAVDNYN